jgi:H+-transporting ATPase
VPFFERRIPNSLLTAWQIIIQEGDTVPADAQLICDFDLPEDFEVYKQLRAEDKLDRAPESDEDNEDGSEKRRDSRRDSAYILAGHRNRPLVAVDQSAITGESLAVEKYMGDVVYYTTGCKRGKAYAIVTATAKHSFVGRTADLVQGAKDQGHFKAVMNNIGTALLILVTFWILVSWIGGFFHNLGIATPGSQNLLHYALILMIIGVPVGLPVVTTTTLAVGAAYLAKQKAIVQKLTAIESLAVSSSLSLFLCFDSLLTMILRVWTSCAQTRRVHSPPTSSVSAIPSSPRVKTRTG